MKIPLDVAIKLLEEASAVIFDDYMLTYPIIVTPGDKFLILKYIDEGLETAITFNKTDNEEVDIVGSSLFLYEATENIEDKSLLIQVTLLRPWEPTNEEIT